MNILKESITSLPNLKKKCTKFKTELCFPGTEEELYVMYVEGQGLERRQIMLK